MVRGYECYGTIKTNQSDRRLTTHNSTIYSTTNTSEAITMNNFNEIQIFSIQTIAI